MRLSRNGRVGDRRSEAKVKLFLRRWTGPLTADLVLRAGDFGLGKVPARLKPDKGGNRVAIASRRGRVKCAAFVTAGVQSGQLFVPLHHGIANQLTRSEFDPRSRQPSYKHCALRVEAISN